MSTATHYYIYITVIFLAALSAVLFYNKKNKVLLPVVVVLIFIFLSSLTAFFTGRYLRGSRPVNHFITPIMLAGWGLFFSRVLEDSRVKKIAGWVAVILILFSIIHSFITGLFVEPWIAMRAATIFYLILGALLLMQLLELPSKENIFTNTFFLIALGIVWFNMISSLSFFLADFMSIHKPARQIISYIHWYSNYIYYSILMLAMIFQKKLYKNA